MTNKKRGNKRAQDLSQDSARLKYPWMCHGMRCDVKKLFDNMMKDHYSSILWTRKSRKPNYERISNTNTKNQNRRFINS